jgi:hypothetical protein
MIFSSLKPGIRLKGLLPGEVVQIITTESIGDDALDIVFRKRDGSLGQMLIYRGDTDRLSIEADELPWKFDADAARVRLTSEAYRIKLAHLFDPHLG